MGITYDLKMIVCAAVDVKFKIDNFHIILERVKDRRLFTTKTKGVAVVNYYMHIIIRIKAPYTILPLFCPN